MMVNLVTRKDRQAWLKSQTVETRYAISSRDALRVLPNIGIHISEVGEGIALPCMRAILTSAGRGFGQVSNVDWTSALAASSSAAHSAADFAFENAGPNDFSPLHAAFYSALSSGNSASNTFSEATHSIDAAADSLHSADLVDEEDFINTPYGRAFEAFEFDANQEEPLAATLPTLKAWNNIDVPVETLKNHHDFLAFLSSNSKWDFWRDWYEAMWNGTFDDWELAFEVIAIDNDVWEGDDAAKDVAEKIEQIKATRKLEAEIASLKEKLHAHEAIATTGHNQGPPLDDITERRKAIQLVWPLVEELDEEIEKPTPDLGRLQSLFAKLSKISLAVAKYCASKADKSIDVVVTTGTKAYLAVGAGEFVGINEGIVSVVKALAQLLKASAGG